MTGLITDHYGAAAARVKTQWSFGKPFISILLTSILPKSVIPHNVSGSSVDVVFFFFLTFYIFPRDPSYYKAPSPLDL